MQKLYLLFVLVIPQCTSAQSELRIGEWKAFLPYQIGNTVTQDEDNVYYGSQNGIIKIEKATQDVSFFSKVDGLSNVGIQIVRYHAPSNALVVVYQNSAIDLVFADDIITVDDIRNSTGISGSKSINDVFTDLTNKIYFSCAFGLVEFDMESLPSRLRP
jgi:hypothetical protein